MTCHRCGNPESETVRFFNGLQVRNVFVCKDHKDETVGLPWEETSGLVFKHPVLGFGPPAVVGGVGITLGSPGTPNQYLNAFQSGLANVPLSESTGSEYQGVLRPGPGTGGTVGISNVYGDTDFVVYVSGGSAGGVSGVIQCVNSVTNTLIAQGNDAYQVIQAGLNQLTTPNTHLHIKPGIYILASSLMPTAGSIITGEGGWSEDTQLRASGNIPVMIISGANAVELQNIFFVHNEPIYSGGILKLYGNTTNCLINNCNFYDLGRNTGSAIEVNNGGVFVGPTYNVFSNINIFGFRDEILLYASGGAPVSGSFINGNQFVSIIGNGMANSFVTFKTSTNAHIDGNIFNSCTVEMAGPPTPNVVFDYSTQASGSSLYNKHIGVFAFDLPAAAPYANANNTTYIDCVGCQGDVKISGGVSMQISHYSQYSDQRGYQVEDLIAYVSGIDTNVTVINPVSNTIVASGTDAYQTLQAALNILPSGQELYLKKGIYHVASSLTPTTGQVIRGVAGWSQGTQIRASGNIPAIILSGTTNVTISDIFFVHNEATYSGGILKFVGNSRQNVIDSCNWYDFGNNTGSCIEFNNGGVVAGPTYNQVRNSFMLGFQDEILINVSGVATSGCYSNGNQFENIQGNSMNNSFVMHRLSTGSHADANTFCNIQLEVLTAAPAMFDYNAQFSGFSSFTKHIGVVVLDLQANGVYASVSPSLPQRVNLDIIGSQGDIKISGNIATFNGAIQHYASYVDQKGQSTIVSSGLTVSGNQNNQWFIACSGLGVLGTQGTPNWIQVTPANQLTAQSGLTSWVSNANLSGFTVNTTAAILSGSSVSWYWRAAI